eukprot:TCALIF_13932-PA protein Name:"Protein of unknown function" AED:0.25 eAED:0.25 QI:0/0/0/0.5/1/1/2/0/81
MEFGYLLSHLTIKCACFLSNAHSETRLRCLKDIHGEAPRIRTMGKRNSKFIKHFGGAVPETNINFDSFEVLRAIGRGSFGK